MTATPFNLRNDSFGIHQIVYRWARRFIDTKQYQAAIVLMDAAAKHWIYAVVPNFSPLTLDSLMSPADAADPKTFDDFEVAHHPDTRAHEIYAAAHAGLDDMEAARRYLAALQPSGPPYYLMLSQIQCRAAPGKCPAGKQTLEQGRKLFPKSKEINDALKRLK